LAQAPVDLEALRQMFERESAAVDACATRHRADLAADHDRSIVSVSFHPERGGQATVDLDTAAGRGYARCVGARFARWRLPRAKGRFTVVMPIVTNVTNSSSPDCGRFCRAACKRLAWCCPERAPARCVERCASTRSGSGPSCRMPPPDKCKALGSVIGNEAARYCD
jgi:hypothetical protein